MPLSPSPASTTARDDVTSASVPADETGLAQTRQPPPFLTPPMQAYPASAGGAASSGAGAASYVASAAPPMQHAYYRTSADAAYAAAAAAAAAARNDHMHYPASLPSGPAFLNNSMLLGDISALTPPPPSIDCTRSGAGGVWSPYPTANTCAGLPQQAAPVSLLAPATQTQPPNPAAAGNPGAVGAAAPASAAAVPPPSMMAAPAAVAAPTGPTRSGSTPASSPQPMRPRSRRRRRKYNEIERIYVCGYEGCTKAYGTLNHLNAHVLDHNHGPRRTPEEFSEIRAAWRERKRRQEREAMAQLALQQEQEASRAAAQLTPVFLEAPTYYDMLRHPSLRQPPPGPFAPPPHMLMPPHAPAVMNAYSQVPLAAVPPPPHPLYPYSHVTPGYECPAAAAAAAASAYPDGALWGGAYANYAGANYYKEGSSAGSRAPRTLGDGGPADNFGLSNT